MEPLLLSVSRFRIAIWLGSLPGEPVEEERMLERKAPSTRSFTSGRVEVAVEVSTARQPREWYGLLGGSFLPGVGAQMVVRMAAGRVGDFGPGEAESVMEPFGSSVLLPEWNRRIALGVYPDGIRELWKAFYDESNAHLRRAGVLHLSHGATRPFRGTAHREAMDVLLGVVSDPSVVNEPDEMVEELSGRWANREMPKVLPF